MIKNKIIRLLGGYTEADILKVATGQFDTYDDLRRLGIFYPAGVEVTLNDTDCGGTFKVMPNVVDNNGTTIVPNASWNRDNKFWSRQVKK